VDGQSDYAALFHVTFYVLSLIYHGYRFEAFDEPWKSIYNTATEKWETAWGIMDSNRNLKAGITIPNCGGKTVT